MSKSIKDLEEDVRKAKFELAAAKIAKDLEEFDGWMKKSGRGQTIFKCERCGHPIYHTEGSHDASCLCNSRCHWAELKCIICHRTVEIVVTHREWDGHRGHTIEHGRFKVYGYVDIAKPPVYFDSEKLPVCKDCAELEDLEWLKEFREKKLKLKKAARDVGYKRTEVRRAEHKAIQAQGELLDQLDVVKEKAKELREFYLGR